MMQRKHPGEAMTGAPGALPGEAIRPILIVALQSQCAREQNAMTATRPCPPAI
jgi:hypothetical protein